MKSSHFHLKILLIDYDFASSEFFSFVTYYVAMIVQFIISSRLEAHQESKNIILKTSDTLNKSSVCVMWCWHVQWQPFLFFLSHSLYLRIHFLFMFNGKNKWNDTKTTRGKLIFFLHICLLYSKWKCFTPHFFLTLDNLLRKMRLNQHSTVKSVPNCCFFGSIQIYAGK